MLGNFINLGAIISGLLIFVLGLINEKDVFNRTESSLHLFQLEEYNIENYLAWLKENFSRLFTSQSLIESDKTPIVYTDRMKRLKKRTKNLNRLIYLILILLAIFIDNNVFRIILIILALLVIFLQPLLVLISGKIQEPKEKEINMGFYKQAQEKINTYKDVEDLKVVGITGSFGKTSTKVILETILEENFKVQSSPSSYNTPMGLSKIINNELTRDKEILIAEMGAYVKGEIKEITDLVSPDIGILTSIGPMHLDSFGSIENIIATKYELIEALPENGLAIFNYDNKHLRDLADREERDTIKYGLKNPENLDIYASDIKTSRDGSSFKVHIKGEETFTCTSKMLGKHNILNLLAGIAVAYSLGMDQEQIKASVAKTESVEHRLSLIKGAGGTTIIDDAFNSNPSGARAALEVLKDFDGGKKIIVTPGMIALGDIEEEENYKLGKEIAKVCDLVYLVGRERTKPIYQGLTDSGFDEGAIVVVSSLDEASKAFGPLLRPGDVILFENDLPDNYSEV